MADAFPALEERHIKFIRNQKIFFVATAPLAGDGMVNLSPKGYDSILVEDASALVWIDLGGSGIETMAHLKENGRITLMWCAFDGPADILRVYGRGETIAFGEPGYDDLMARFPQFDRARAFVRVRIDRVSTSCGWGVPFYEFKGEREQLHRWVENRPVEEWIERRYQTNAASLDGLPGLERPEPTPE